MKVTLVERKAGTAGFTVIGGDEPPRSWDWRRAVDVHIEQENTTYFVYWTDETALLVSTNEMTEEEYERNTAGPVHEALEPIES